MQRFGKFSVALLLAFMLATPAFAMNVSPSGQGDALIFPLYVALDGGWSTKFTVINTSEMYSTVAKLVIRSWKNSQETLDFLIFLSPADVWTGTLSYDPAMGAVVMKSTDDSVLVEVGVFASAQNPMVKALVPTTDKADNNFLGYAYVINAATNPTPSSPGVTGKPFNWYYNLTLADGSVARNNAPLPPAAYPRNILTGYADVSWAGTTDSFALKPVALNNYQNKVWIDAGQETWLGLPGQSSMGLLRLEDLLAKRTVRLPYYNNDEKGHTFHFFTFPTKVTGQRAVYGGFWYPLGATAPRNCADASAKIFDLTEKFSVFSPAPVTSMCTEIFWVEALPSIIPFPEGWIRYSFASLNNAGRFYPPVIPFVINVGPQGLFSLQTAVDPGPFNRFSFADFPVGVPSVTNRDYAPYDGIRTPWDGTPDPAWVGWDADPGLNTGFDITVQ